MQQIKCQANFHVNKTSSKLLALCWIAQCRLPAARLFDSIQANFPYYPENFNSVGIWFQFSKRASFKGTEEGREKEGERKKSGHMRVALPVCTSYSPFRRNVVDGKAKGSFPPGQRRNK